MTPPIMFQNISKKKFFGKKCKQKSNGIKMDRYMNKYELRRFLLIVLSFR